MTNELANLAERYHAYEASLSDVQEVELCLDAVNRQLTVIEAKRAEVEAKLQSALHAQMRAQEELNAAVEATVLAAEVATVVPWPARRTETER